MDNLGDLLYFVIGIIILVSSFLKKKKEKTTNNTFPTEVFPTLEPVPQVSKPIVKQQHEPVTTRFVPKKKKEAFIQTEEGVRTTIEKELTPIEFLTEEETANNFNFDLKNAVLSSVILERKYFNI